MRRLTCPQFVTQGAKPDLDPGKHLEAFYININFPKACDPRSFSLTLRTFHTKVNLPKACDPRSFSLTLRTSHTKVNLPKACDLRSRTRLRFCLTLKDCPHKC